MAGWPPTLPPCPVMYPELDTGSEQPLRYGYTVRTRERVMGYGDKLVATNSVVKTVHVLATTTERGVVTVHPRTACGLTGYRPANAAQLATAARCAACTSAANEHAAWWERTAMTFVIQLSAHWTEQQVASLPRRERSWFRSLRAGGFVPAADAEAATEAFYAATETFTGTRRAGGKGEQVTVTARVLAVREIEGSTVGKKGKVRPMQREVRLAGTGAHQGVEWTTTTRSAGAGRLAVDAPVTVTARVSSTYFRGRQGLEGLGQLVTNAAFA